MKLFFTAFFSSMLAQAVGHTGHSEGFGWEIRESTLPKALSDHTASLGSDLLVYIAGGCGKFSPYLLASLKMHLRTKLTSYNRFKIQ
jgi:hypothetical protein